MSRRALALSAVLVLCGYGFHDGPALPLPVRYHTATALSDGRVLIVGGGLGTGNGSSAAWLYEPWSARLTRAADTLTPHQFHSATLLRDGTVLIAGGKANGTQNPNVELFDPATESWRDAGRLGFDRERHTATLLDDGSVLLYGNFNQPGRSTADLYDHGVWRPLRIAPDVLGRGEATAVRLLDGRVLVMGGAINIGATAADILSSTVLYRPDSGTFIAGPSLSSGRRDASAVLLPDGGVVIGGGRVETSGPFRIENVDLLGPAGFTVGPPLANDRWQPTVWRLPDLTVAFVAGSGLSRPVELFDSETGLRSAGPLDVRPLSGAMGVPTADGLLLLTGGDDGVGINATLATLELRQLSSRVLPNIPGRRERHSGTLLPDGRVLIAGGAQNERSSLLWQEDGGFADAGQLAAPRVWHSAVLLPGGDVLLLGGASSPNTAERCSLSSGCRLTAPPPGPLIRHATALLHDGRVLVAGGSLTTMSELGAVLLYDPASDTWADAGSLAVPRHQAVAVTTSDGRVLISVGYSNLGDARHTELFDPATRAFADAGFTQVQHGDALVALLPGGHVVAAGGLSGAYLSAAETWSPSAGWTSAGPLGVPRAVPVPVVMRDDRLYATGGTDAGSRATNALDRFDPETQAFTTVGALAVRRYFHSATLLPSGEVLLVGGLDNTNGGLLDDVEVLRLGPAPSAAVVPGLDAPAAPVLAGSTVTLSGSLFTGVGEAVSNGSRGSAAEAPVFRFERWDNQEVSYVGATAWNAVRATVRVPAAPGWWQLTVSVAGVPSRAVPVLVLLPDGAPCVSGSVCEAQTCAGVCGAVLDAGVLPVDAGVMPVDAGVMPVDAGVLPVDAGVMPVDAGVMPVDAGVMPVDAGVMPVDAGTEPTDAGTEPLDAGVEPPQLKAYAAGCGCNEAPPSYLLLLLLLSPLSPRGERDRVRGQSESRRSRGRS